MGYTWEMALAAAFVEGIIFLALSMTNVREQIFNSIPMILKLCGYPQVSACLSRSLVLQECPHCSGQRDSGWNVLLQGILCCKAVCSPAKASNSCYALIGVLITGVLLVKRRKGSILWGILITWALGIVCPMTGLTWINPEGRIL